MSSRTVVLAAALLIATATMAACGSTGAEPDVSAPGFGDDATGVVTFWDRNTTSPYGQALVNEFNATHPHLKVELTQVQDTVYVTKLATAIRAGSQPDLVGVDDINSQLFIHNQAFADLTPVVNQLPFLKSLSPGQLNLATDNGRYYGVPYVADVSLLWYNKALFRKAGLDPNTPPTNYADILADAKAVAALGNGISGFSFAGRCEGCLGFTVLPDIWATGTYLLNGASGAQTADVAGNAALRRTLQLYRQLWAQHLSSPTSLTESGATWGNDFLTGKVGIFPGGYGTVTQSASTSLLRQLGVVALPGPDGGTSIFDGGANFAIPKGAKNASGAWEFIKFALSKESQTQAPAEGFTPVRNDVLTPAYAAKYPFDAIAIRALNHGYAPKTLAYNLIFNQPGGPWLTLFTDAVIRGDDLDGALRTAQTQFTDAITEAES
ncbi:MAG TPA: sugar ABC transporter substrate-binding protein [Pseudonocardiaceae bacterium]|nr:sugar ABC transporter substrate-binding protein [Pseudonocardiaceae bacterium]